MIARARAEQQEVKMSEQVRDFYAKEIDFDNGPVKCVLKSDYDALHAEAEALRAENWRLAESLRVAHHNLGVGFDTETALTGQLEAARGLLRELIGAVRTINHGPQHKIMVKGDDQPSYWQRQEWVVYLLRMCNEAEAALTATPAPEVQAEQGERQEAGDMTLTPDAQKILTECIGAHAYVLQALVNGRPDLALTEAKKWVDGFKEAADHHRQAQRPA